MMRFVAILILIVVGYFVFRHVVRMFTEEMRGHGTERNGYQHQKREYPLTEEECYKILGVTDKDSPATIRKKYKEILAKYHPDKVQHLGIEFQEMAERKTKAIMESYEFFRKKYNL